MRMPWIDGRHGEKNSSSVTCTRPKEKKKQKKKQEYRLTKTFCCFVFADLSVPQKR